MEQLLTLWVDDLKKKKEFLSQCAIAAKARSLLIKFNKKKVEMRHSVLAKDGLQGSSYTSKFIA